MASIDLGHRILDVEESAEQIDEILSDLNNGFWVPHTSEYRLWDNDSTMRIGLQPDAQSFRVAYFTDAKEGHKIRVAVSEIVAWGD
jgi:hypothetical protein